MHIRLFSLFSLQLGNVIARIPYILTLISPRFFYNTQQWLRVFSFLLTFIYCNTVGFRTSVQRSFLLFSISLLNSFSTTEKIILTFFFQSIFFPQDLASSGFFMSWGCYFIVISETTFFSILKCQFFLSLLVFCFTGKLSLIGLIVNLVLIPIFPYYYITGWMILFRGYFPEKMIHFILQSHYDLLESIPSIGEKVAELNYLFFDNKNLYWLRLLCCFIFCIKNLFSSTTVN